MGDAGMFLVPVVFLLFSVLAQTLFVPLVAP